MILYSLSVLLLHESLSSFKSILLKWLFKHLCRKWNVKQWPFFGLSRDLGWSSDGDFCSFSKQIYIIILFKCNRQIFFVNLIIQYVHKMVYDIFIIIEFFLIFCWKVQNPAKICPLPFNKKRQKKISKRLNTKSLVVN